VPGGRVEVGPWLPAAALRRAPASSKPEELDTEGIADLMLVV